MVSRKPLTSQIFNSKTTLVLKPLNLRYPLLKQLSLKLHRYGEITLPKIWTKSWLTWTPMKAKAVFMIFTFLFKQAIPSLTVLSILWELSLVLLVLIHCNLIGHIWFYREVRTTVIRLFKASEKEAALQAKWKHL